MVPQCPHVDPKFPFDTPEVKAGITLDEGEDPPLIFKGEFRAVQTIHPGQNFCSLAVGGTVGVVGSDEVGVLLPSTESTGVSSALVFGSSSLWASGAGDPEMYSPFSIGMTGSCPFF